jgi:hypothetical protein
MTKRDCLDYLGNKIGELELPDDTSEDVWSQKLAIYAAPPPHEVIKDVTPRQIRQALILSGVTMASIDSALSSLPEPTQSLAKAEWEYSISFQRNRQLVTQMGSMLGWSSAQLDALWKFAGTL